LLPREAAATILNLLDAGANARYSTDLGETIFDALPESEERRQSILVVLAQHGIKAGSG